MAAAAAGLILAAAPSARAATVVVTIAQLVFSPKQITARVGDTVVWNNDDFIAHTATGRAHQWDLMIPAHGSARVVLRKPGTIDYFCRFHPNMTGQITVGEK